MDYGLIFEIGTVGAAIAGSFYVAKWRGEQTDVRLKDLEREFHRHQLDMAEKYVTSANFEKFEVDMKEGFKHISDRLDKVLAARRSR